MKKSKRVKRLIAVAIILVILAALAVKYRNTARQIITEAQQAGQPTAVPNAEIAVAHANGMNDRYPVRPPHTVFTFVKNNGGGALLTVNTQQVQIASDDRVCVSSFVIPAPFNTRGEVDGDKRCFTVADAQ